MGSAVKHQVKGKVRAGRAKRPEPESPLDRASAREVDWAHVSLFNAARGVANAKFVYAIGEEELGPVKIGVAKDPIRRLRGMQTGNPRRLRVERVVLGDVHTEQLLHELWETYAIFTPGARGKPESRPGTEWFKPEIRNKLFPILATAGELQAKCIVEADEVLTFQETERCIRKAHGLHDFIAKPRDEVRLLGVGAGYVIRRRSRV